LISDKYRVVATVSAQTVTRPGADVEAIAARLLELREKVERRHMEKAQRTLTLTTASKKLPFGVQIEYFGHDSAGRELRYFGLVASTKVVNLYLETYGQSEDGLSQVFRELLKGLRF
jgi:hypothetical protein